MTVMLSDTEFYFGNRGVGVNILAQRAPDETIMLHMITSGDGDFYAILTTMADRLPPNFDLDRDVIIQGYLTENGYLRQAIDQGIVSEPYASWDQEFIRLNACRLLFEPPFIR